MMPGVSDVVPPAGERQTSAGSLLELLRLGLASTHDDLVSLTGSDHAEVSRGVEQLRGIGLVDATDGGDVGDARDAHHVGDAGAARLDVNRHAGVLLAADLGATHSRVAVTHLDGDTIAEHSFDMAIGQGPEIVIGAVRHLFGELLAEVGRTEANVWGIGVGVPGPVEFASGRPVHPPIMPGWDGVPVPMLFAEQFPGVPVLVDNDVNVMAIGEHRCCWPAEQDLLFVKVGTGIGCGVVVGGGIHRGTRGSAGDIGHIKVTGRPDVQCHCGHTNCLEAHASGSAMARRLSEAGRPVGGSREVVAMVRAGDPAAARLCRESGRMLGEVLAAAINLLNPGVIVVGGDMAQAGELLLSGVRSAINQRSTRLASRDLRLVLTTLGDRAGVVGAAAMISERALAPQAVDRRVRQHLTGRR